MQYNDISSNEMSSWHWLCKESGIIFIKLCDKCRQKYKQPTKYF